MSPFERFGMTHLSYSNIRKYSVQPAAWVCSYLYGVKDEAGAAAWRGTAVEKGLDALLLGVEKGEALNIALLEFENKAMGVADDKTDMERKAIPAFLDQASTAVLQHGAPLSRQKKISIDLPGIEIPLIGYIDYEWADFGLDLKTTHRLPSSPSMSHCEQMSVYMKATGKPFSLAYVTTKKSATYPVTQDMADQSYRNVVRGAAAIRHMLSLINTREDALKMFAPDWESFYWNGGDFKDKALELMK